MKFFKFFGEQEHRVFNYKSIYYDRERDERRSKFAKRVEDKEDYAPGNYLKGAFRDGAYQKIKTKNKVQTIIGIVGLILFVAIMFLIIKFYAIL